MKNKTLLVFLIFLINFFLIKLSYGQDQFNFNVSEIEILENGNKIIGSNGGKVSTDDGIIIEADNFIYRKNENVLNANGKVIIRDTINNYIIYSENVEYEKSYEKIFSKGETRGEINSRFILNSFFINI